MAGPASDEERLAALCTSFDDIGARLDSLEAASAGKGAVHAVEMRFQTLDDRLSKLETRLGVVPAQAKAQQITSSSAHLRQRVIPCDYMNAPDQYIPAESNFQSDQRRACTVYRCTCIWSSSCRLCLQWLRHYQRTRVTRINAYTRT